MMRPFKIGALLGIPILVSPSWLFLFGGLSWVLATQLYPAALRHSSTTTHFLMAGSSVLLFFASIILHELAHSAVAKAYRIPVKSITLFLFGGVAQITREASKPMGEFLMAIAGPATSLVLGVLFAVTWFALGATNGGPLDVVLFWLAWMNGILALFNLLPAFPMDGGRVFRSLIWMFTGNYYRATNVASWAGRGIAWSMMATGALAAGGFNLYIAEGTFGGLWLILVGLFLENAARQGLLQNRLVHALRQYSAGDLMIADPPVVEPAMSVASLARGVLELNPRVCYFVEDHGKLAGIVSAYQMRAVPEGLWERTTAGEAMIPSSRLRATPADRPVHEVLIEMESENLLHMPVVTDGRVVGVIGRDRIITLLRQAGLLPAPR
ncbi:MAG: site-2 protease family protein [Chloroflexi bacterium]|nr:site-2 protease family protein [Chloroflexota bacterium]